MWILSWRNYKHSKLATFISIVGAFTIYGGVMLAISKEYIPGIITAAIGIAIRFGAEKLAQAKAKKLIDKRKSEAYEAKKTSKASSSAETKNVRIAASLFLWTTKSATIAVLCL